ncbi:MAG: hypothetical protein HY331_01675, partial [Chloroflexi bacterium]|nr:hypothetical protein [Chloroflexota bacterium]
MAVDAGGQYHEVVAIACALRDDLDRWATPERLHEGAAEAGSPSDRLLEQELVERHRAGQMAVARAGAPVDADDLCLAVWLAGVETAGRGVEGVGANATEDQVGRDGDAQVTELAEDGDGDDAGAHVAAGLAE